MYKIISLNVRGLTGSTGVSLATSAKIGYNFFCKKLIPRGILLEDGRQNGEAKSYLAMDLLIAEES